MWASETVGLGGGEGEAEGNEVAVERRQERQGRAWQADRARARGGRGNIERVTS